MFNFTININDLTNVLKIVGNTVGKNLNNSNDDCIEMESTGTGVIFRTNNSVEYMAVEVVTGSCSPAGTKSDLISFDKFNKMISTLQPSQMITIENDNNKLEIKTQKGKPIVLYTRTGFFLPQPALVTSDTISVPAAEFINAVNKVCAIIEPSPTSSIYECVRIETNGQNIDISCLDYNTKRMASYTMTATCNNPSLEVLIQGHKFAKHAKIFADAQDLDLEMDNGFVNVRVGTWLPNMNSNLNTVNYFCRRFSGSFPNNITQMLSKGLETSAEVSKEELMAILTRIGVIEDKDISPARVKLVIDKDNVNASYSTAYGKVNEDITLSKDAVGSINAEFRLSNFVDIMNNILGSDIEIGKIKAQKGTSYYLIHPTGASTLKYGMSSLVLNTP